MRQAALLLLSLLLLASRQTCNCKRDRVSEDPTSDQTELTELTVRGCNPLVVLFLLCAHL